MSATNSPKAGWLTDDEPVNPERVLAALEDDACRTILEATSDDALTATELSEQCDIPMSTAYRKVETLTEASLVDEQVRINTSGKHATEYVRCFDDVVVSLSEDTGVVIELTQSESETAGTTAATTGHAVADD
ncbi:helix-turn-helix transcriptional regulator [Natronolimnobius sp. AArcel1]|uniref:winged helix-turn-helix domain-containing protein n=1 Tax=Natronolimnobius sp. AArcel1 TaxID=1679093 RepID=UPI0013ECD272|nr:helix-turn-helix domain-containing protein [Natronolimnobius sp. AArcel1]NGM68437.1 helix-turn-helix transcriptional regulator [Natronolimnobius sp. AArcel1]